MDFIRKHILKNIESISGLKVKTNYIFFDETIKSGNFDIIGMRKIDFHPIVKTKFTKDGIGGVDPILIKSIDLIKIYFKLKNNNFTK
jgi:hypothetical protein